MYYIYYYDIMHVLYIYQEMCQDYYENLGT